MAAELISVLMWKYSKMNHVIVSKSFVACLAMCFSLAADSFVCFYFHISINIILMRLLVTIVVFIV